MDIKSLMKWGKETRYNLMNGIWILCLGYFIFKSVSLFIVPSTFPIPVQIKKLTTNQLEVPINEIFDLKTTRSGPQLYLKHEAPVIPTIFYLNALLFLLYIASLLYMSYQAKILSFNIYEKETFHKSNVRYLKNIGRTLAIVGFLFPIFQRKITAQAISDISFPNVILSSYYPTEWVYYVAGILFIIIAKAFERGFELQEEQALTV